MIETKRQFEDYLRGMRAAMYGREDRYANGFRRAVNAILKVVEDEGECFNE